MNRPQYILLPVSPLFIFFSLFCAVLLNMLPWGASSRHRNFVALTLVFWGVHQPRKVGIGTALLSWPADGRARRFAAGRECAGVLRCCPISPSC